MASDFRCRNHDHASDVHSGHLDPEALRPGHDHGRSPQPGESMASVTLERVTKRWGDVIAVNDVSLKVEDDEFMVLLGPSGCGKTTTMRMIAGLEEPTDGKIYIGKKLVNDELPKDRDVAMVFQNYGLYPRMSVYENIRYPLKVRKVPK